VVSHALAQRLRPPGYAIMAMLTLGQFVDVAVRSSPFRVHSPAWRLGYVSATTGDSSMVLVALFLALLIAAIAEDRRGAYVIAATCWVLCLGFAVAIALFGLDVLQFKGQVPGALAEQYGVGSAWITVRMVIAVGLFMLLGLAALRLARAFEGRIAVGAAESTVASRARGTPPKAAHRA
jgi:hypothetical protein